MASGFAIVGCAHYKLRTNDVVGKTAFRYYISKFPSNGLIATIIPWSDQVLTQNQLTVWKDDHGNYAE
jgi:hypothetical protein